MLMIRAIFLIVLAGLTSMTIAEEQNTNQKRLFEELKKGNVVAIMRHALAPGTGDPENFAVGQCDTQRNLSVEGEKQANRIGDLFRQYGINTANVFSSQWCRCMDTATGLELGAVTELPSINSFFRRHERKSQQTEKLKAWLKTQKNHTSLILVTHQVNITALTGIFPSSGEIVFIRTEPAGDIVVEGSIRTN